MLMHREVKKSRLEIFLDIHSLYEYKEKLANWTEHNFYIVYNWFRPIGCFALNKSITRICALQGLHILEKYRNQGFGSKILKKLRKKYTMLGLHVKPGVEEFYKKNNFFLYEINGETYAYAKGI